MFFHVLTLCPAPAVGKERPFTSSSCSLPAFVLVPALLTHWAHSDRLGCIAKQQLHSQHLARSTLLHVSHRAEKRTPMYRFETKAGSFSGGLPHRVSRTRHELQRLLQLKCSPHCKQQEFSWNAWFPFLLQTPPTILLCFHLTNLGLLQDKPGHLAPFRFSDWLPPQY